MLADYKILPPVHGLMKVKTLSEQVAPTCQTILGANGSCGFQGPVHGKVELFLDWHPLPTVPADPEVSWPFLRRDRQLPTLQCARRCLYCLWLVFMILRVISSLINSKFSVLPHAVLPAQESRTAISQEPQELLSPVHFHVPGFTLLPTLGSCDSLLQPVYGRYLHISTGGLSSCSEPHTRNVWGCCTWLTQSHREHLPAVT